MKQKTDNGIFRVRDENGDQVYQSTSLRETIAWLRGQESSLFKVSYALGLNADVLPARRFLEKFDPDGPHD